MLIDCWRSIPGAIGMLGLLLFAPAAQAEDPACGSVLTKNTKLVADMHCPGPALRFEGKESKNVTLNCAGHGITATLQSAIVATDTSGITIKNCEISTTADLSHAILFDDTRNSTLKNNVIVTAGADARGIELRNSKRNTLSGNHVHSSGNAGSNAVRLRVESNDNLVENNHLEAADAYPVEVETAHENRIPFGHRF